jgi:photosystem II stability/assembly factor-like uncharacterized protein
MAHQFLDHKLIRTICFLAIAITLLILPTQPASGIPMGNERLALPDAQYAGKIIDAHTHIPVSEDSATYTSYADEMVKQMEQANADAAVFMNTGNDPDGTNDPQILAQSKRYPNRLIPFLGGFDPSSTTAAGYVLQHLKHEGWKGIGEVVLLAPWGVDVPADSATMMAVYRVASQFDAPVAIYFNLEETSNRTAHEAQLEHALKANPDTTFWLLHSGFGFATLARLASYPNLYLVAEVDPNGIEPLLPPGTDTTRVMVGTHLRSTDTLKASSGSNYTALLNAIRTQLGNLTQSEAEKPAYRIAASALHIDGNPFWVRTGGPPGGIGYDIRYSFSNPNTWFVTDNYAGAFISIDNGLTWQPSNTGIPGQFGPTGDSIPVFSLTVDPHNPQIVWAGTDLTAHIYKSTDGGFTWTEKDKGVEFSGYDSFTFRGFTVDPTSSDIVYAMGELKKEDIPCTGYPCQKIGGRVYKTTDGGENWQVIWDGGIPSSLTRYLWINPQVLNDQNDDILYVSTGIFDRHAVNEKDAYIDPDPFGGLGILKSTDSGQTWEVISKTQGLDLLYIGSLYMHPKDPDTLFAAAGTLLVNAGLAGEAIIAAGQSPGGIYRTTDGGEHWTKVLESTGNQLQEVLTSVEICVPPNENILYAGSADAIYRSEDGGTNWTLVSGGSIPWGPPGVEAGWPIDFQCDPRDPNRLFANNYLGGNFLSEDGGKTWKDASAGYTGALILGVAVDPLEAARVYAVGRSGPWGSQDGGSSWYGMRYPPKGMNRFETTNQFSSVAVDPDQPSRIYVGNLDASVQVSSDRGYTWEEFFPPAGNINPDFDFNESVSEIVFAPSDHQQVYLPFANIEALRLHEVCGNNDPGFAFSSNGGLNWSISKDADIDGVCVYDLAVSPTQAKTVFAATSKGLVKSTDGGSTWSPLSVTGVPSGAQARAVAISPGNQDYLLVAIDTLYSPPGTTGGVYLSKDGGLTWKPAYAGLPAESTLHSIVFDPTDTNKVYISDFHSGVYQSADGGQTWTAINGGLHTRAATRLDISSDGQHLYAATDGEGVFRLDLNGQPPEKVSTTQYLFLPLLRR